MLKIIHSPIQQQINQMIHLPQNTPHITPNPQPLNKPTNITQRLQRPLTPIIQKTHTTQISNQPQTTNKNPTQIKKQETQ